jgi:NADPH2:quinone reductase
VRLQKGQAVLIYGAAGGMGNALIDLAKAAGLIVVGIAGSETRARFARDLGADHVINRNDEDISQRVQVITRGRGVDAIFDPVGGSSIPTNIGLLAPNGVLILYGALGGTTPVDLESTLSRGQDAPAVRHFTIHAWDNRANERRAGMRAVIDMLDSSKIKPRIHGALPLSEAPRAHEMLQSGVVLGKLLLRP